MSCDLPHRSLHLPSSTPLPLPLRSERRRLAVALLIVFTWVKPAPGQLEPRGPDFQVNSYTPGDQDVSRVAVGPDGSMVLVWQSPSILDPFRSIEGRFYDGGAAPLGTDLQVNIYTTSSQFLPNVSIAEITGDVVVVWTSVGSSGSDISEASVQAQRFTSTGIPLGGEFQVNSYTTYQQHQADVAVGESGEFVVVWTSEFSPTGVVDLCILARLFDPTGTPGAGEFQVNTHTPDYPYLPHVAMASSGEFVVVWDSEGSPGTDPDVSVQARRFAADGSPIGDQFQVNTATSGNQYFSAVDMAAGGEFVVVWQSAAAPGDGSYDIQAQRFAADGSPVGSEIQVNAYTTGDQLYPKVGVGSDGSFLVAWEAAASAAGGSDPSASIQARHFTGDGAPMGPDFQVNTYTTGDQSYPSVGSGSGGRFVVTWESTGSSGSDFHFQSVQARIFDAPLFADGFESGDTSAWTAVTLRER